jgi:hypothetical protein
MPNGHKLHQTTVKYTNIFHSKALQNIPKLGFLVFKYKPSGNPDSELRSGSKTQTARKSNRKFRFAQDDESGEKNRAIQNLRPGQLFNVCSAKLGKLFSSAFNSKHNV